MKPDINKITNNRLHVISPITGELDLNRKITENFTALEWYNSTKILPEQRENIVNNGIPLHPNIIEIAQLVRDFTGKAVFIGSSYRSYEWDKKQGRSGNSQHCLGLAVDLNGEDVYELLHVAVMTQNELYQQLKALGANFFGFYSWGVHIDLGHRVGQPVNMPMVRYYGTKKKSSGVSTALIIIVLFMYRKTILKLFKRK
ncbi:D-Ala-D-Ala carboxypeptidase family metallohydrolase [Tenacibaculum ovolyticum]|uniref:D-Ala-D-Ala carboxypeptidase family metallohydrolase n=1 Tax=Tenacibaculum ovolyticum TaxID=104270 RepID=UPI001F2C0198|nr:D-Ala-D-Ala carboxypeptidase family metallohydrolase [Tenacibaculum ovolyticum]